MLDRQIRHKYTVLQKQVIEQAYLKDKLDIGTALASYNAFVNEKDNKKQPKHNISDQKYKEDLLKLHREHDVFLKLQGSA